MPAPAPSLPPKITAAVAKAKATVAAKKAVAGPWTAPLLAVTAFVDAHHGRFPNRFSVDPAEAELGLWWAYRHDHADTDSRRHELDVLEHRAEQARVAALRAYIDAHDGHFPTNRDPDRVVADLGTYWITQHIRANRQRMSPYLREQLTQLREHAGRLREQARARRAEQVREEEKQRQRAITIAAGKAGAKAAAEALKSPHLIPGDRKLLQLRIDNPTLTIAELAELAGLSPGKFTTRYYGALRRGPNSRSPLKKDLADRLLAPGEAADLIGVPRPTLSRWADAGLIAADRNRQGHRRYLGAEVLRVKDLIAEGWPPQFVDAAEGRGPR